VSSGTPKYLIAKCTSATALSDVVISLSISKTGGA
jgi:hypothetical protein